MINLVEDKSTILHETLTREQECIHYLKNYREEMLEMSDNRDMEEFKQLIMKPYNDVVINVEVHKEMLKAFSRHHGCILRRESKDHTQMLRARLKETKQQCRAEEAAHRERLNIEYGVRKPKVNCSIDKKVTPMGVIGNILLIFISSIFIIMNPGMIFKGGFAPTSVTKKLKIRK
jgi:hypothetical protein